MAQLPQTQDYRVQIAQAPSAATPAVSFGQNRRPEVEFQQAAQYAGTLGQVLDRMSTAIFGQARVMAEQEGYQYVASRPATDEQLNAMINGSAPVPSYGNPLNVFNAAVRKARAIELSTYAENEGKKVAVELLKKAETGWKNKNGAPMDTETALSQLNAFTDGFTPKLAQIDPEASLKFRATMATIGNTVIDKISQRELRQRQIANQVAADMSYDNTLQLISGMINADITDPDIEKKISSYQSNFFNGAAMTVSLEAANQYQERFRNDIEQLKGRKVANFVSSAANPSLAYDAVRKGKTGDPYIDSLVSPTSASRFRVMDAARKELGAVNALQEQQQQIDARQAEFLEADFYDALGNNNTGRVNEILAEMRVLAPSKYTKMRDEARSGGVFARTDSALVVSDLEMRMNNPYGPVVTINDVAKVRSQLTQSTFVRLVNAAKASNDEQIKMMKEQAANRLGMNRGPVLNRDVARQRQEKQMADLEYQFFLARRKDPNVDALIWLDENFDKVTKASAKTANTNIADKVTSRTYKTVPAFDEAIRNARRSNNTQEEARLIREKSELQQAIKEGLVDENGNKKVAAE